MLKNFFSSIIGSEKTGQHLLIVWLVVLTSALILVWGSQMSEQSQLTILFWLVIACGVLIPVALGIEEYSRAISSKVAGLHADSRDAEPLPQPPPPRQQAPYATDHQMSLD
jgi:hypothetical protein